MVVGEGTDAKLVYEQWTSPWKATRFQLPNHVERASD